MSSVWHSYVIRMSSVCHSYVIVYTHPYVTCMYSYVIRMSLVCTRMSPVFHSYILVYHPYVTHLWFYHEPFPIKHILKTILVTIFPFLFSPFLLPASLFFVDMNLIFHRLIVYEETIKNRFYLLSCFSCNFYFTLLYV